MRVKQERKIAGDRQNSRKQQYLEVQQKRMKPKKGNRVIRDSEAKKVVSWKDIDQTFLRQTRASSIESIEHIEMPVR